ncbi:MAG TPA: NAD(P)H-hydrate dehydratase, partial [Pyrinomonadaceae bacterium]
MKREPTLIDAEVLRRLPLPLPDEGGDKEERGRVLVVGGGRETPGAVVLAGTAALRAGAGKLQVATGASNAALAAAALPEARVFALPETRAGKFTKAACAKLEGHLAKAQCVCVGPGMIEDESVARFVGSLLGMCRETPVVLDAGAVACLAGGRGLLRALGGRAVVTPNADELEEIYGQEAAAGGALRAARRAAEEFRSVVVM